jgi:ribonucleoside-diphosphate reductase alpha chain
MPDAGEVGRGLVVERVFTKAGEDPLEKVEWVRRDVRITEKDGTVIFEMKGVEAPKGWSQLATDIVVGKYFRKGGVPQPDGSTGSETSVRQIITRVVHTLAVEGDRAGWFRSDADRQAFADELTYMLVNQYGAFNSPVWFNVGLFHEYGIRNHGGGWAWDEETGRPMQVVNGYERPQGSACFVLGVGDSIESIFQWIKDEARIFQGGSGSGVSLSKLRAKGEKLSGGGTASGPISFARPSDRAAGAITSGGTTRRAAKFIGLDDDHPDVLAFIEVKAQEDRKARALIAAGYTPDEAYDTVGFQNANLSVRLSDAFMHAVEADGSWSARWRRPAPGTDGIAWTRPARDIWKSIAESARACADPGVQYADTINAWHTTPASGRINSTNPCSEFAYIDDSACNLASLNLTRYLRKALFATDLFRHAARIFLLAQEILVGLSNYPTAAICRNSHDHRPLGLGHANLGGMLMGLGIPYDSDQGRALAAGITALMTGEAYRTSAEMAASHGAFPAFAANREAMTAVLERHRKALGAPLLAQCPPAILQAATLTWEQALDLGRQHGWRNAQTTLMAPCGTIGFMMDVDTTGIEPVVAALVAKKLAGGGTLRMASAAIERGLRALGYGDAEVQAILEYVGGTSRLLGAPYINGETLLARGLTPADLARVGKALARVFQLEWAFAPNVIGEETLARLGLAEAAKGPKFSLLEALGFTRDEIREADAVICGHRTVEGAPHLRPEHLAVFDCAMRGGTGRRMVSIDGHLGMMAAIQPFLSGAISKTCNIAKETTAEEIGEIYRKGWKLGLKAVAVYRDGSKALQPLTSARDEVEEDAVDRMLAALMALAAGSEPVTAGRVPGGYVAHLAQLNATARRALGQAPLPDEAWATPEVLAAVRPQAPRATRRPLPKRRRGITQEAKIGGTKMYLRTGEYADGTLGEIWITQAKTGSAVRSLWDCFAIAVSIGLQHGAPLEKYVDQFLFTRFEPFGVVEGHERIRFCTSPLDFFFRDLAINMLGREDLAHAPAPDAEAASAGAAHDSSLPLSLPPPPRLPVSDDPDVCLQCGGVTIPSGRCRVCTTCGTSGGCS